MRQKCVKKVVIRYLVAMLMAVSPVLAMEIHSWKAILVAGDAEIEAFDNARRTLDVLLQAKNVPRANIRAFAILKLPAPYHMAPVRDHLVHVHVRLGS